MLLLVCLGLLLCSIFYPRSKLTFFCISAVILVVFGFVYFDGDVLTYEELYTSFSGVQLLGHFEPLFALLMAFCKAIRFPFVLFRVLVALIYIGLNMKFISKATDQKALALIFIFMFPTIHFCSVMRSGLATGVVLLSLWTLLEKKKNAKIWYCTGIICATLCHYSSIVFIAFLFIDLNREFEFGKLFWYFMISLIVAVLLNMTDIPYQIVSRLTNREKTLQWFVKGDAVANLTGTLIVLALLAGNAYLSMKAKAICHNTTAFLSLTAEQIKLSTYSYNLSMIMLLCLPLFVFASPFLRISYMITSINVCSWLNAAKVLRREMKGNGISLYIVVSMMLMVLWRLYVDLPYIKQGAIPFGEIVFTRFML